MNERERVIFETYGLKTEKVYYGRGCRMCRNTGYLGRTAIGELMKVH